MSLLASPIRTKPLIRTGKYGKRGAVDVGSGKVSGLNHEGVDVRAATGTPFYPMQGGEVVQTVTGWSPSSVGRSLGQSFFKRGMGGNQVVIRVSPTEIHNYGHASSIRVSPNQKVTINTLLGYTGASGGTKMAPHLHVGIWRWNGAKWVSVDPTLKLPWEGDTHGEYSKIRPGVVPPAQPTPSQPVVETAEQREERELMAAIDIIRDLFKRQNDKIDEKFSTIESRLRAEARGYILLDLGEDGSLPVELAQHAVLMSRGEGLLVLQPPAKYGLGQINSMKMAPYPEPLDYRFVDSTRWAAPLTSGRFWNRVKDSLMMFNHFKDDRVVTVEMAQEWVAKWEARKQEEVLGFGETDADLDDDITPEA